MLHCGGRHDWPGLPLDARNGADMSIDGFVLPPRITLEEATRGAAPTGGVKRKELTRPERHTNKGKQCSAPNPKLNSFVGT